MAYVRAHGNQLAIVHGERDPETRKVQQRVLFSLYSKPEALAALGRGEERSWDLERMLRTEYPEIRFDWDKIKTGIEERMETLPDIYSYRTGQVLGRFRDDMVAFIHQLEFADPQSMYSAAQLLSEQRIELEYVRELIDWRLQLCEQDESEWNGDNAYFWRHRLQGRDIPPEAMDRINEAWNRREIERVEALARLYIECFEGYADGYHYLGLVALERDTLEAAIKHFGDAMVVGRKLFPKRLAKKHYWSEHRTRPYMRALRSMTVALNRAGAYEEALDFCARQEKECGDTDAATTFRSSIFLNMGRWEEAREESLRLVEIWPEHSLVAAFAWRELGELDEALACFLHGALNRPRTARMLMGLRSSKPQTYEEARDHNGGIDECDDLEAFLDRQPRASRRFFLKILEAPQVVELLKEAKAVRRQWHDTRTGPEHHDAFARMNQMQTVEFARKQAASLRDVLDCWSFPGRSEEAAEELKRKLILKGETP